MDASGTMLALDNSVGKMDAYLSLAVAAYTFGLNIKPEIISKDAAVRIEKARNILTEF